MIKGVTYLITVALLVLASSLVSAYDPSPLQDFYVAINNTNSAGIYVHTLIIICSSSNFHLEELFLPFSIQIGQGSNGMLHD